MGLGGVRRLTDEVDFDIRLGEGMCVWARKFAEPVRRRREVGTLGRYLHGERCSGDHAAFVRLKDALILAVADGLGHGQLAREASLSAIRCVTEGPERALDEMLVLCHAALQRTRGAVMSVTRIEEPSGEAALAGVGNVSTNVCGPGVFERHIGSSAALGMPGQLPRIRIERAHLRTWDALVQFTDGLSGRASLDGEASLLREHPIVIAQHLLEKVRGRSGRRTWPSNCSAARRCFVFVQEMPVEECRKALAGAGFGRLACARENQPYVVPVSFAVDGDCVYLFSMPGQKIEWMRNNPRVCLEIDSVKSLNDWTSIVVFGRYEELPDTPDCERERLHARELLREACNVVAAGLRRGRAPRR